MDRVEFGAVRIRVCLDRDRVLLNNAVGQDKCGISIYRPAGLLSCSLGECRDKDDTFDHRHKDFRAVEISPWDFKGIVLPPSVSSVYIPFQDFLFQLSQVFTHVYFSMWCVSMSVLRGTSCFAVWRQ